jgi:DNA-binding IscR family transcriptional regulator
VHGGYALARRPEAILVGAMIEALEGPIALTECSEGSGDRLCEHEEYCPLRAPWTMINHAVRQALHGIRLADIASPNFRLPMVVS